MSSGAFICLHHMAIPSKKGITQIIVKRENLMYLGFQVKSFAS